MMKRDQVSAEAEMNLEEMFSAARAGPVDAPPNLAARVLADARAEQGAMMLHGRKRAIEPGPWQRFQNAIGGWPSVSGLTAAVCAGFWIGLSAPSVIPSVDTMVYGTTGDAADAELIDLAGPGWWIEEGIEDAG